ncbi:probable glutamate receptor isoform X2 [Procambarus clarkii]|uniref:probable glutamate receptor isoform X2 n=1 Tax=Procambarus clarkii TaxID=6728 RepID=UPI003743854A
MIFSCRAVGEETLRAAGRCVAAVAARVWRPRSSVILLTDGSTSPSTVFTELGGRLDVPWGMTVFEVAVESSNLTNLTEAQLYWAVTQARKVRQVSWLVMVVVVSDDPTFLAASAEWAIKGHLLLWANRLLAITRRPLSDLRHLHTSFSMMNAMLLILDASSRCSVWVHVPYSSTVLQVAKWTPHRGLSLTTSLQLFPEKFYRFTERPTLSLTTEEFPPHVEVRETGLGHRYKFSGAMVQLLQLLGRSLNFSFTIVRPPDGSFGTKLANGTATGMTGMVGRKEVDLGLGPFGITAERAEIVDYTAPVVSDSLRILGGQGRPEVDPWGFLLPLSPEVWAALLGSLLVVLVALLLLASFFSVGSPMLSIYFRMTIQKNTAVPAGRWWERLVLASWMLMMLVLMQSYSGNLMSLLAVRYIPQPFQTLRALLDSSSSTTMIWEYNTAYVNYFRTSKSGIFREVHQIDQAGHIMYLLATEYSTMLDHLVREGPYAFVGEGLTIKVLAGQDFSKTGRCDFYTSREAFMSFLYCMIGPKTSPLIPSISRRIRWMTEAGLYEFWMRSLNRNSTVCVHPPSKITVRTSLSLTNVWGMFVFCVVGDVVGLMVLGLELVATRLHHTQRASSPVGDVVGLMVLGLELVAARLHHIQRASSPVSPAS